MFTTSFRHTEAALIATYAVPAEALGAFRGRITNLQKLNLFGPEHRPGRGKALPYGPDQFHRLIFACEVSEMGASPATIVTLVERFWESDLVSIFGEAERAAEREAGPEDVVLYMGGVRLMMLGELIPNIDSCTLRQLSKQLSAWMGMDRKDLPPRFVAVNLSARLRTFHAALVDSHEAQIRRVTEELRSRRRGT
jgi:hypothetical protein